MSGVKARVSVATTQYFPQMYRICLRQEKGYCSIRYGLPKEKSDPFHISDQVCDIFSWAFDFVNI